MAKAKKKKGVGGKGKKGKGRKGSKPTTPSGKSGESNKKSKKKKKKTKKKSSKSKKANNTNAPNDDALNLPNEDPNSDTATNACLSVPEFDGAPSFKSFTASSPGALLSMSRRYGTSASCWALRALKDYSNLSEAEKVPVSLGKPIESSHDVTGCDTTTSAQSSTGSAALPAISSDWSTYDRGRDAHCKLWKNVQEASAGTWQSPKPAVELETSPGSKTTPRHSPRQLDPLEAASIRYVAGQRRYSQKLRHRAEIKLVFGDRPGLLSLSVDPEKSAIAGWRFVPELGPESVLTRTRRIDQWRAR